MLTSVLRTTIPHLADRRLIAPMLCLAWLGLDLELNAADWPRWRGPANDGHVATPQSLGQLPASPVPRWRVQLGAGLSSPVVAGGKLAIMDHENDREVLRLFDATSGKLLWKTDVDDTFTDTQGPPGPRNTPVLDGDRVYAVSCRGELQCRQLSDGRLLWRVSYTQDLGAIFIGERGAVPGAARHGNNGSPLVDGPHLITPVGGTNGHSIVAFDKLTGRIEWHSQNDMAGYGAPVVADLCGIPQVVAFTVDGVIGLDRTDGRLLWRVPLQTAYGRHVMTPVVWRDQVIVGSHQIGLVAIRVERTDDAVRASTAWVSKEATPNFAQAVVHGDSLYTLGPKRDLLCLNLANGQVHWRDTSLIVTPADRAHCSFMVLGDEILLLTDSGELILFRADVDRFQPLGRVQVCALTWCNPAYVNGVLYLRDGLRGPGNLLALPLHSPGSSARTPQNPFELRF